MQNRIGKMVLLVALALVSGIAPLLLISQQRVEARNLAQPALPSRFYGTVTLNGDNVAVGTLLAAVIGQQIYATTTITVVQGVSSYVIDIPGDDPGTPQVDGGREGDIVYFTASGYTATQQGIWQLGRVTELNLTLTNAPLPQPTLIEPPRPPTPPSARGPVTIPEPTTLLLLSAGLAAIAAVRARRPRP